MRFLFNNFWDTDYDYAEQCPGALKDKCVLTSGRYKGQEMEYWFVEFSDLSDFIAFIAEHGNDAKQFNDETPYLRLDLAHECD